MHLVWLVPSRSHCSPTFLHVQCRCFSYLDDIHADERLELIVKNFFHSDSFGTKPDVLPTISKDEERELTIMENIVRHVADW